MSEIIWPQLRAARPGDAAILTAVSFQSKSHWKYPPEYFAVWRNELTITARYIAENDVAVIEDESQVFGYFSMVELKEEMRIAGIVLPRGHWLDHMFLLPGWIGKGYGTALFAHMKRICEKKSITTVGILADPHARGFYEKMGCRYVREYPSTIANRTTPCLILELEAP